MIYIYISQDSQGFPRVRYGLLGFARISQGLTRPNKVAQGLTRSHMVSQGLTRSHKVPQGPKRSHKASQGLTRSHKVSQGLTWSHKVSQERIYFRSVWRSMMMKYVWCWRCAEWQRSFVEEKRKEVIRDYRCCPECLNAGAGWLRNWTSWASLEKHHWTHISRSDMASRSGIASRSDIVGRLDIQSVGSVFLLVLARLSVRSNGIYIYIYIYIKSFSGWPFLGTLYHTYVAKTPPEHTFLRYTDLSSNSIQQHRVPAWPAGRPRESQHGLLVV